MASPLFPTEIIYRCAISFYSWNLLYKGNASRVAGDYGLSEALDSMGRELDQGGKRDGERGIIILAFLIWAFLRDF